MNALLKGPPPIEMDAAGVGVQGIEALCSDQGVGFPVLFVHGWGATHRFWRELWPKVVPRFRSLAVDLPGHGMSAPPPEGVAPTVEWYADWLAALLGVKGVSKAAVIGHSMGGTVALLLASRHPGLVERLVLINPVAVGRTAFPARVRMLLKPGVRRVLYGAARFGWVRRWLTRDYTNLRPLDDEDASAIRGADYRTLIRSFRSLYEADVRGSAGLVTAQTLVLSCFADRLVAPEQSDLIGAAVPRSRRTTLPEAGHCAQLDAPELVLSHLMPFLADLPRAFRPPQW